MNLALISLIRNAAYLNQGELSQYSYLASILHRNLKGELAAQPVDKEKIENSLEALINYLNRNLNRVSEENFKILHQYFNKRSRYKPRICIKANYGANIVELFRDQDVDYIAEYPIDTNTGFQYVHKNGTFYLCNNIPEKANLDQYNNPRLDNDKVKTYQLDLVNKFTSSGHDNNWISCWRYSDHTSPSPYSAYKSTLIIPLTLRNNKLSDIYKKLTNIEDIDRTIFGFLCFDHINANYFNDNFDVEIGYIFADFLSLYLIQRLNYTSSSETFIKAIRLFHMTEG